MEPSSPSPNAASLFRWLLSLLSLNQLSSLWDLYQLIKQWWPGNTDMYEILDYEAELDLTDAKGKTAIFRKHQKVKFLQNNIIAFEDYVWGDGDVLVDYQCSPGVVVDRYQEGDRWNILISLRETKSKGDIAEFYIERKVQNGFLQDNEWLQTEVRRRTHRLKMNVIFPSQRRCQRATLQQRTRNRVTVLGPAHFHNLPDGRQLLSWGTDKVRPYDVYMLKWRW